MEDGKHLLWVHGALEWLNVGLAHAFHHVQLLPNICNQLAAAIVRVVSSVVNVDDFRCEIFTDDPQGKVTHLWCRAAEPSLSWMCGAHVCSMVSTVVRLVLAQLFHVTKQLARMSCCLPQIKCYCLAPGEFSGSGCR